MRKWDVSPVNLHCIVAPMKIDNIKTNIFFILPIAMWSAFCGSLLRKPSQFSSTATHRNDVLFPLVVFAIVLLLASVIAIGWAGPSDAIQNPGVITSQPSNPKAEGMNIEDAKRVQKCRDKIDKLEDQIKQLERGIEHMKKVAEKIKLVDRKIEELLPIIIPMVGTDPQNVMGRKRKEFADMLANKLKMVGIRLDPGQLETLTKSIMRGGQSGIADAMSICFQIAELSAVQAIKNQVAADRASGKRGDNFTEEDARTVSGAIDHFKKEGTVRGDHRNDPAHAAGDHTYASLNNSKSTGDLATAQKDGIEIRGFSISPADIKTASNMSGQGAVVYVSGVMNGQMKARLTQVNDAIDKLKGAIKSLRGGIRKLEQEIEDIEKAK